MNINVLSKREFNDIMQFHKITDDNVENYEDVFFISLNDTTPSLYHKESWFKRNHENVMVLYFDDVESENETSPTNTVKCTPFSESMAEDLYDFIVKNLNRGQCIVHCEAGISRSGAVGTFICDLSNTPYVSFVQKNPHIYPNSRVLRMLNYVDRNKNK